MDIIEFLIKDHVRLRKEIRTIKSDLAKSQLRGEIKVFIASYELHESIEEEILFPRLSALPEDQISCGSVLENEELHTRIWALLEDLMDSLGHHRIAQVQKAFSKFSALTESHIDYEESVMFPAVRKALDKKTLEDLGKKVDEYCARFSVEAS